MSTHRRVSPQSTREGQARRLFRQAGFRVEAVPFIRARDEEFMAIVVWPLRDVAEVVDFLANPKNVGTDITRIHVGSHQAHIYVKFTTPDPRVMTSWDQIEAAMAKMEEGK